MYVRARARARARARVSPTADELLDVCPSPCNPIYRGCNPTSRTPRIEAATHALQAYADLRLLPAPPPSAPPAAEAAETEARHGGVAAPAPAAEATEKELAEQKVEARP